MDKLLEIRKIFDSLKDESDGFRYKVFRHGYYMGEYRSLLYALMLGERYGGEFYHIRIFHNNIKLGNNEFYDSVNFHFTDELDTDIETLYNTRNNEVDEDIEYVRQAEELNSKVYEALRLGE